MAVLSVKGVNYLGNKMDLLVEKQEVSAIHHLDNGWDRNFQDKNKSKTQGKGKILFVSLI